MPLSVWRFCKPAQRLLFEDRAKTLYGLRPSLQVETSDERCYHQ
jgi:hypothetical protein